MINLSPPPAVRLPYTQASSIDPAAWSAVASELRSTVAKLVHIEDSLAPPCTCLMCLDVFKVRAGHLSTCQAPREGRVWGLRGARRGVG